MTAKSIQNSKIVYSKRKFVFGFIGREILVEDGFPDVEIICGADINANTLVQIMILVAAVRQWRPNGCGGLVRWV